MISRYQEKYKWHRKWTGHIHRRLATYTHDVKARCLVWVLVKPVTGVGVPEAARIGDSTALQMKMNENQWDKMCGKDMKEFTCFPFTPRVLHSSCAQYDMKDQITGTSGHERASERENIPRACEAGGCSYHRLRRCNHLVQCSNYVSIRL